MLRTVSSGLRTPTTDIPLPHIPLTHSENLYPLEQTQEHLPSGSSAKISPVNNGPSKSPQKTHPRKNHPDIPLPQKIPVPDISRTIFPQIQLSVIAQGLLVLFGRVVSSVSVRMHIKSPHILFSLLNFLTFEFFELDNKGRQQYHTTLLTGE